MKIKCPLCNKLTTWEENPNRPFCSERCRITDLGRWMTGEYAIGGNPADEPVNPPEKENNHA